MIRGLEPELEVERMDDDELDDILNELDKEMTPEEICVKFEEVSLEAIQLIQKREQKKQESALTENVKI